MKKPFNKSYHTTPEICRAASDFAKSLSTFTKLLGGKNPADNYFYRSVLVAKSVSKTDPSYEGYTGRTGPDYKNNKTSYGELKSASLFPSKRNGGFRAGGIFMVCKQDEKARRDATKNFESFTFAVFNKIDESTPLFIIYLNEPKSLSQFRILLIKSQREFLKKKKGWDDNGEGMHWDTANIGLKDLLTTITEALFLDADGNKISRKHIVENILKWTL